MKRWATGAFYLWTLLISAAAHAQGPPLRPQAPPQAPSQAPLRMIRVLLACDGCDVALKADVTFVEYVTDREQALVEVAVVVTSASGVPDQIWSFTFTGRGTFAGQDRRLTLSLPAVASADEVRGGLARVFRLGLAEYAFRSDAAPHLDVTFRAPTEAGQASAGAAADRAKDPWNYWVFRVSASSDRFGEASQSNGYYSGSVSASRTTDAWKIRMSGYKSGNSGRFRVSDDETIRTREGDWSTESLIVKSLGPHWSAGLTADVSASTYSNQELKASVNPAVEFDFFPYSESSQRSLTLQYAIGASRYKYRAETVYGKFEETMPRHSLTASLGLRQPWGTAGASASFSQSLNSPGLNRFSVDGSVNIRLFRGLSVNASTSFSRIRDQFYLEKSDATEEEILLRLRQLATGHRYYMSVGLSYSFGSLSNATVNPRFGG